ncbi:MAG: DUF6240 domain-containing protein [Lachnospiraceae bacterium]|nr:DUF6240 domain-containing protein [Lachnospiraceae bacterium]
MKIEFLNDEINNSKLNLLSPNHKEPGNLGVKDVVKTQKPAAFFEKNTEKRNLYPENEPGTKAELLTGANVKTRQDYMTVMSHCLTPEDFNKAVEDGYDLKDVDMSESVTIVDRIKAEVLKSGKVVAGFNDDLNQKAMEEMPELKGISEDLLNEIRKRDTDLSPEIKTKIKEAVKIKESLNEISESAVAYMVANNMEGTLFNLYMAGASAGESLREENAIPKENVEFRNNIVGYLSSIGVDKPWEKLEDALFLVKNDIEVTKDNLTLNEQLREIELPLSDDIFVKTVVSGIERYDDPLMGVVYDNESIYEKAVFYKEKVDSLYEEILEGVEISDTGFNAFKEMDLLDKRKALEEVRLMMTVDVNISLIRSGFSIETVGMEEMIDALGKTKEMIASKYFPGDESKIEKYDLYEETKEIIDNFPKIPLKTCVVTDINVTEGLRILNTAGTETANEYIKAGKEYETMMTKPSREYKDSIKKAFRNVDEVLRANGLETTSLNQKALRGLSYNNMEVTPKNILKTAENINETQNVMKKLTPAKTLEMIRDGVNPLKLSIKELGDYLDKNGNQNEEEEKEYSKFLYSLEKNREITKEERDSYIGIYRLIHMVEKGDGRAEAFVSEAGLQLNMLNLLKAVRNSKSLTDWSVGDDMELRVRSLKEDESIIHQIDRAFKDNFDDVLKEFQKDEERDFNFEEYRELKETVLSKEAEEFVRESGLKENFYNTVAVHELINNTSYFFKKFSQKDFKRKLSLTEDFYEDYGDITEENEKALQEQIYDKDNTYLDVKALRLLKREMKVMRKAYDNNEFFMPLETKRGTMGVHFSFRGNDSESGATVNIDYGDGIKLNARLGVSDNEISGICYVNNESELKNIERLVDIFSEHINSEGSFKIKPEDLLITQKPLTKDSDREGMFNEKADRESLYRITYRFLKAFEETII